MHVSVLSSPPADPGTPQVSGVRTLKIHLSVTVQVDVAQDLIDLTVVELLPHELLHGLPQLSKADLAISIRVKLGKVARKQNKRFDICCFFAFFFKDLSTDLERAQTSLKASLSSFTPIISAVSASILGPISSTKSSKSTLPPPEEEKMKLEEKEAPSCKLNSGWTDCLIEV